PHPSSALFPYTTLFRSMTWAESDLELSTQTDELGAYQITDQISGEFEVTFEKEGYNTVTETVNLENGEHKELQVAMSEFNIAVLSDYKEELSSFLKEQELAAVSVDWNIIE